MYICKYRSGQDIFLKICKKIFIRPGFLQKKPSAAGLKPLRFRSYAPVLFFFPAGGAAILSAPDTLRSSDGRWQPHNRCGGQYFPPGAVVCSHSQSGFRYPKKRDGAHKPPVFHGQRCGRPIEPTFWNPEKTDCYHAKRPSHSSSAVCLP